MSIFDAEFMRLAFATGAVVGVLAPGVGFFLVQRQMSLIGDGIGHAAFAGPAGGEVGRFVQGPIGHRDEPGQGPVQAKGPHDNRLGAAIAFGVVGPGLELAAAHVADFLDQARRLGRGIDLDFAAKGGGLGDAVIGTRDCCGF
jgi:hypothetical protein